MRRSRWLALLALLLATAVVVRRPLAREFLDRGKRARAEWRLADAQRQLNRALLLDSQLVAARVEAANVLVLRGEFSEAIGTLRAIDLQELNDALAARHGVLLGTALFQANEAAAALASHEKALGHARRARDRGLEADALVGMSRVLYHLHGRPDDARRNLEQALAIGRELGDARIEGDALRHLAVIRWWFQGERGDSIVTLAQTAVVAYRKAGDLHGEAVALNNMGLMHGFRRDLPNAMRHMNEGLRIRQRIGDAAGMADSWAALGDMYVQARNYRKGRELYVRSANAARKIGYLLALNEVENKLADIYVTIGELDPAVALFESLAGRERGNPLMLKYRMAYLAELHQLRGDGRRSLELARRVAELEAGNAPERGFSYVTWMKIADAHRLRGDLNAAVKAVERAESFATPGELPLWRVRGLYQAGVRAEILLALGRRQEALHGLAATAEDDLGLITDLAVPAVLLEKPYLYDRIFRILLDADGDAVLAARYLEQLRCRSLLDVLGHSRAALPRSVEEIRHALAPGTAIVEYVVAGQDVFAIVITEQSVHGLRLPVASRTLSIKTRLLRALLFERKASVVEWMPVAADLRRVLLEPLESAGLLAGIRRLEIVPWGVLRELPFAALARQSAGAPRFLAADYVLSLLRSASSYAGHRDPSMQGPVFCFAKRRFDDEQLPALPHAEEEGRAVASRTGGELRLDEAATEEELRRVAPRARAIHFATHAVIDPDLPLLSHLLLTGTGNGDGRMTVPELLALDFNGALITLGACRSSISNSWGGADEGDFGRVGLVEAVLHAGAGSVVATLAPVNDRSTSAFMQRFYANGVPDDPAGQLAATQRSMPAEEAGSWAAFVVWR